MTPWSFSGLPAGSSSAAGERPRWRPGRPGWHQWGNSGSAAGSSSSGAPGERPREGQGGLGDIGVTVAGSLQAAAAVLPLNGHGGGRVGLGDIQ